MTILCPHCKETLIIRCYYERYVDFPAEVVPSSLEGSYLSYDESDTRGFSDDQFDEFDDYECAKCKESVKEFIGKPIRNLPDSMKKA